MLFNDSMGLEGNGVNPFSVGAIMEDIFVIEFGGFIRVEDM